MANPTFPENFENLQIIKNNDKLLCSDSGDLVDGKEKVKAVPVRILQGKKANKVDPNTEKIIIKDNGDGLVRVEITTGKPAMCKGLGTVITNNLTQDTQLLADFLYFIKDGYVFAVKMPDPAIQPITIPAGYTGPMQTFDMWRIASVNEYQQLNGGTGLHPSDMIGDHTLLQSDNPIDITMTFKCEYFMDGLNESQNIINVLTLNNNELSMNYKKLKDLAPGTSGWDAVNYEQYRNLLIQLNKINSKNIAYVESSGKPYRLQSASIDNKMFTIPNPQVNQSVKFTMPCGIEFNGFISQLINGGEQIILGWNGDLFLDNDDTGSFDIHTVEVDSVIYYDLKMDFYCVESPPLFTGDGIAEFTKLVDFLGMTDDLASISLVIGMIKRYTTRVLYFRIINSTDINVILNRNINSQDGTNPLYWYCYNTTTGLIETPTSITGNANAYVLTFADTANIHVQFLPERMPYM